jgi:hypothetical protein
VRFVRPKPRVVQPEPCGAGPACRAGHRNEEVAVHDTDDLVLTLVRELDDITVADRIRQRTALELQERLDARLIERVGRYAEASRDALSARLGQLEREWSIERVLALQSSATAIAGIMLGTVRRRWLLLSLVTSTFLMQHSVQGWCPPLELHRRLGFRTQREIELEMHMLKLIRGDYAAGAARTGATA